MSTVLLLESGLASLLAIPLGYLLGRKKGAVTLFILVLFANALVACVVGFFSSFGIFPIHNVPATGAPLPDNCIEVIRKILEIAIWTFLLMGCWGYILEDEIGAAVLVAGTVVVTWIFFFIGLAFEYFDFPGTAIVLRVAIFLSGIVIAIGISWLREAKNWAMLPGLWASFYAIFVIGYAVAGRWGVYLISWPAILLFSAALYYLSQKILPVGAAHRQDAFRSLITFALGTNYAYYVIDDWKTLENYDQAKPKPRVPANTFRKFLSGPGIVLSDSNHLTVTSDGFNFRVIPPGLGFTYLFEQIYEVVDLRPQLRTEKIKAQTKDGIVIQTNVFLPHRIATRGRAAAIKHSYPFDENAVKTAVCNKAFVDHDWRRDDRNMAIETVRAIPWDERVLMTAPACLKDIFIQYPYNMLYAFEEQKTGYPREIIAEKFLGLLREKMKPMGIELVGGGLGNIESSEAVEEQRIANWQAKWKEKIENKQAEAEAILETEYGSAWAEAQLGVLQQLTHLIENADSVTAEALAFQLVTSLGTALPSSSAEQELPFEDFIRSVLHHNQQ